ncbi:MAG: IS200/IS605 family transposase [Saprospiraceae bacterium]|nr:IS200/IS605 family transposase [Saprospiraceae bacterium]
MANTYTQLYIQLVFAVKHRNTLIERRWKEELHRYITGIVENCGHKLLRIHAMPDHIHILIGYHPDQSIASLVKVIKMSSNHFINEQRLSSQQFAWQKGYGAFSYSRSQVPLVARYIEQQEQHHAGKNFRQEYLGILNKAGVPYEPRYLFDFFE